MNGANYINLDSEMYDAFQAEGISSAFFKKHKRYVYIANNLNTEYANPLTGAYYTEKDIVEKMLKSGKIVLIENTLYIKKIGTPKEQLRLANFFKEFEKEKAKINSIEDSLFNVFKSCNIPKRDYKKIRAYLELYPIFEIDEIHRLIGRYMSKKEIEFAIKKLQEAQPEKAA